MTAPNQSIDNNIVKSAVGLGAYEIGGGGHHFGQDITEDFVHSLVLGPSTLLMGITGLEHALEKLGEYLATLPLQALQMFKGFLPGRVAADFADVATAVSTILSSLFVDPLGSLRNAFNQIGDIVNGLIVVPISSAIADFSDWFRRLLGFQDTTKSNQINLQNFTISTITAQSRNPVWVCRYPVGDVTYPEFMNAGYDVFGTTDAASTGTAHTHTLGISADVFTQSPGWYVAPGASRGSFVTVSNSTVIDTIGMSLFKDASSLNNVFLELFREDVGGGLTRIASVEVSAQITSTTSLRYVEASIPAQIVQAGERYLVRVRNATTNSTTVLVQGIRPTSSMVQTQFQTTTSTDSNKTSYTASEVATSGTVGILAIPWGLMAAKNLATTDQSFSDDFNRSAIGGLWSLISVADVGSSGPMKYIAISGNKCVSTGSLTDGGALFKGTQSGIYVRPTAGDGALVEANLYPGVATGFKCGVCLHVSRDGSQAVGLFVDSGSAKISTGALTAIAWADRDTSSTGGDGLWSLVYDPDTNTYTALKDGEDIGLSWTDASSEIQHGRDFRYGAVRHRRDTGFGSGPIDNWTLRDWSPATP